MPITREIVFLRDFADDAEELRATYGKTDLYSTGCDGFDNYLSGGYGRENGYEIVVLFGSCVDAGTNIRYRSDRTSMKLKTSPVERLYKRSHGIPYRGSHGNHTSENIQVRCVDEDTNELTWIDVLDITDEGEKECYQLTTKSGMSITTTKEHKFYTGSGFKEMQDLKIGDIVMLAPTSPTKKGGKKTIRDKEIFVKYHPSASKKIVNGCTYYRLKDYRLIYEASKNNMSPEEYRHLLNNYDGRPLYFVPDGIQIDHINGNHKDNRPNNMQELDISAHAYKGIENSYENLKRYAYSDKVVSIVPVGKRHTYDIYCDDPHHNFVADNFIVHNTGIGKSLVGLNFLRSPLERGKSIGIMALEDDGPDIYIRFGDIIGTEAIAEYVSKGERVFMMSPEAMSKSWKLDELLDLIESWFVNLGVDVILLDHLQFAFENAEMLKGENEYIQQRVFMQRLNHLMKKIKKTIILVSHVNKDSNAKGLNRIVGSGSIAQAGTKVIEVKKEQDGLQMQLHKSRFTATPDYAYDFVFEGSRIADVYPSAFPGGRR